MKRILFAFLFLSLPISLDAALTIVRRRILIAQNPDQRLLLAAAIGDVKLAREILDVGANIDVQDSDKETPVYLAARNGHMGMVEFLVKHGANLEMDVASESLLFFAKRTQSIRLLEIIQKARDAKETALDSVLSKRRVPIKLKEKCD